MPDEPTPEQLAGLADGDDIPVDDHPDQSPHPVEPT
jgi:hypothetical protein